MSFKHILLTCVALLGVIQVMQCAFLTMICNDDITLTDNFTVPLRKAKTLLSNKCYDKTRETIIYTFGYTGKTNGIATVSVLKAIVSQKTYNTMLLDWQEEASSISISNSTDPDTKQIFYVVSGLPNAINIGNQFGYALVQMARAGLELEWTYLVGFSLGAQVFAIAARVVIEAGLLVWSIIGLDPAGKFWGSPPELPSLRAGDATGVLCIHTDPGNYGINETLCQVDAMVNFEPFTQPVVEEQVQPGCPIGDFEKFSTQDLCSHNFSWMLFIEFLKSSQSLVCSKADNVRDWEHGLGNCSDIFALSLDWDRTKSGVYFVATEPTDDGPPYGLGLAGSCPS